MKKRVLSLIISVGMLFSMIGVSAINTKAAESELKKVEGSYLTLEESSVGTTYDGLTRGIHMMDGECSISKAGTNRIYAFGATTANHEVDYLAVIVYVDRYLEDKDAWGQVDAWVVEDTNDFFVYTGKTITVERGYYYRVHADHFVREGDDPIEETFSATNGIWVGPPKTTE